MKNHLSIAITSLMATLLLSGLMTTSAYTAEPGEVPGPAFKEVLGLKSVGSPVISPDGKSILYTIRQVDWEKNRYDTEIWLYRDGRKSFQLTRTQDGSSSGPAWSPDGNWISFTCSRDKGRQIYLISPEGGEAFKFTSHKEGVNSYSWSPDGKHIAFTATEPKSKEAEAREKQYGRFEVENAEYRLSHLWKIAVDLEGEPEARQLTSGDSFTVGRFRWSPDGKTIAFDHRPDPLINSSSETDISLLDVSTGEITPLVAQPGPDSGPLWSPDGRWVLFNTKMGDDRYFTNSELARIAASNGDIQVLTEPFDENLSAITWTAEGIYCLASQTVYRQLFLLDPERGRVKKIASSPENIYSLSFADDGKTVALYGMDRTSLTEVYRTRIDTYRPERITDMTGQVKDWRTGRREVVRWKSKDGAEIEGILWKPEGYAAGKRYPLLVIIHGGPSSTSRPALVSGGVYPYLQWL
ncbi:MAG: S9 family peptidase, partial [Candidatus Aminicenantaceae bacterium]